jgi:hypothetical protein
VRDALAASSVLFGRCENKTKCADALFGMTRRAMR